MTLLVQEVANGLVIGSMYAAIALGFALTFNVMRVVNLAHPDTVAVGMFAALLAYRLVPNPFVAILSALLATALFGLILERTVLRSLRPHSHLTTLIATAGVSIALENILAAVFGADPVVFPALVPSGSISFAGVRLSTGQGIVVATSAVMLVITAYYVRGTKWGRAARAVADRPDVAAAFGINVNRIAQGTVVLGAVMAGVAGLSLANLYTSAWAFAGLNYSLKAFTVMLVAGNRHIESIIAVALGLGIVESLITGFVSSNLTDLVAFAVLLLVLVFRPSGLFGSYADYD